MSWRRVAILVGLAVPAGLWAQTPAPPATSPAGGTTSTGRAATGPGVEASALAVLGRLEAAGAKFPSIVADLVYTEIMVAQGDRAVFNGKVYYQAGAKDDAGKFRIHFDTVKQGVGANAAALKQVEDYVFDGQWLIVAKERIKHQDNYQVAAPDKKIEALQLGRGPFPVPFGQKAETVLKYYTVETRPPKAGDPPDTDYIKLIVRPEFKRELNAQWLELWVANKQPLAGLPVRIVAEDRSEDLKTVVFSNIATPKEHAKDTFTLPARDNTWRVQVHLYNQQAGAGVGPGG